MHDPARELAASFARLGAGEARVALVLGSGLGAFTARLAAARSVPYREIEGLPRTSVPGHAGRLVLGAVRDVPVAVLEGRVHRYEGASAEAVTRAVRALAIAGVPALVLTNAAGGIDAEWEPPLLMRVTDHVDLQSTRLFFSRMASQDVERLQSGARELQMELAPHRQERRNGPPYDVELGRAIEMAAREAGVPLVHGIYAGLLGPTYETPAEVRMLRWLGASAVGMSTVAEASAAHLSGMRVAAVSCVTNAAAGVRPGRLSHEEVVAAGASIAERFCALLEAALPRIAAAVEGA